MRLVKGRECNWWHKRNFAEGSRERLHSGHTTMPVHVKSRHLSAYVRDDRRLLGGRRQLPSTSRDLRGEYPVTESLPDEKRQPSTIFWSKRLNKRPTLAP